jgi:UDP-N-acetylmuramate dehydrogenase
MRSVIPVEKLKEAFGEQYQEDVSLAYYTTARLGGRADGLLSVNSSEELERAASLMWKLGIPFTVLGVGSNVLISDAGYRGVVIINHAHNVHIHSQTQPPTVWAETGTNLSTLAQKAALRGLSGLEWAAPIPGSLGGAIYGNAGAHGSDISCILIVADILHQQHGRIRWTLEQFEFEYRSSRLKRSHDQVVVLAVELRMILSTVQAVQAKTEEHLKHRRSTQPPGASLGSIFKNPPGKHAGHLIEAAGLKGYKIGNVEISPIHANFIINRGGAKAADYWALIQLVRQRVAEKFGINLETEIETLGEW